MNELLNKSSEFKKRIRTLKIEQRNSLSRRTKLTLEIQINFETVKGNTE